METQIIKIFHWFNSWKETFMSFLNDLWKTLKNNKFTLWLNYSKGELYYSLDTKQKTYSSFESIFYTHFKDFQIERDNRWVWKYDKEKAVIWEIELENSWFFPFKQTWWNDTEFILNIFRTLEWFNLINDKFWFFIEVEPLVEESFSFYVKSSLKFWGFRVMLALKFFKYIFNFKIKKDWKKEGFEYFKSKLNSDLFSCKIYVVAESSSKELAEAKIKAVFNNFRVFKNYPLNKFNLNIIKDIDISNCKNLEAKSAKYTLTSKEISSFFHFPNKPVNETSLLKVTARKLALPIWVPIFDYESKKWEIIPKNVPREVNIVWVSDYRSIKVPIWIYDEDRLRHMYVIWKTWVWKSKFLMSMISDDILSWKWLCIIDPHWDLIEEAMSYIPKERMKDVIIFDPSDEEFPFCLNPLDIQENESKQILAKWFIDIFKKFFWANWNSKLEHVLRMTFLALIDKPDSTLFDMIRALTDKDFRYELIEHIEDDVVRNFWTNEFAWWSQQFNTEAIMPILNKVWQLLSIDILKNIFSSKENKIDFRKVMDDSQILLVKLPKWKLQEEIMWFLWAIFVTKTYQASMWRQNIDKSKRTPFFLYIDEFQNFATETFSEILSEARKYWLWLVVAHQFIKQIPTWISNSLFGNVWTLVSFRISSEDSQIMKHHFDPYLSGYDLANLNQREFYCKVLVKWQVKDPFSLKSKYLQQTPLAPWFVDELYEISRKWYSRSLKDAKANLEKEHKEETKIIEKIVNFWEPLI